MFSSAFLAIDPEETARRIEEAIRRHVRDLKRRGIVVGLSGGIDSSVVTCLCARALGAERVQVLLMPERASSPESLALGRLLATQLGTPCVVEDIAPTLEAAGCYERQTEAIRMLFPDYGDGWRNKISLPSILESDRLNVSELTVESPDGTQKSARMPLASYLQMVAATIVNSSSEHLTSCLHGGRGIRIARVDEVGNCLGPGHQLAKQVQLFRFQFIGQEGHAGDISTRPVEAVDETHLDRIRAQAEYDRNCRRRCFCRAHRRGAACRGDDIDSATHKIGSHGWESIGLVLGPPVFDRDVPTFNKAGLAQALDEGGHHARVRLG